MRSRVEHRFSCCALNKGDLSSTTSSELSSETHKIDAQKKFTSGTENEISPEAKMYSVEYNKPPMKGERITGKFQLWSDGSQM